MQHLTEAIDWGTVAECLFQNPLACFSGILAVLSEEVLKDIPVVPTTKILDNRTAGLMHFHNRTPRDRRLVGANLQFDHVDGYCYDQDYDHTVNTYPGHLLAEAFDFHVHYDLSKNVIQSYNIQSPEWPGYVQQSQGGVTIGPDGHEGTKYLTNDRTTKDYWESTNPLGDSVFMPVDTILFKPPSTGTYRFAVDASQVGQNGHFTLAIEDYVIPANASCTGALPVAFLPKKTVIVADTCHGTNEFGLGINCGVPGFLSQLFGSQLYYKVALTAGKTYTFYFTPHYTDARLYLFSGTCAMDPINADCGSNGKTGGITPSVSQDQLTWLKFTPQASSTYVFAVDNTMVFGECGSFRVDIQ